MGVKRIECAGCGIMVPADSVEYTSKRNHPVCENCYTECEDCGATFAHDNSRYGRACVCGDCLLEEELCIGMEG